MSGDFDELTPAVGAAIYRLAQESVTNALRHARARDPDRGPGRRRRATTVRLTRQRRRRHHDRSGRRAGYGLVGMTERADLLGGTCEAGPDGGWTRLDRDAPCCRRTGSAT